MQLFGSGLICPRAQTCMDSKVIRAVVWQRTDLPPDSNMLRRAAQTCSACKLAGVQIIPLSTLANQILARTFFRSLVLLFACPAVGKFSRASSAGGRRNLQSKFETWIVSVAEDCLSPERTFHGCQQNAARFRGSIPWFESVARFSRHLAIKTSLTIQPYAKPSSLQ